ncbi:MAG: thiopurine S-methyltransferase [Planctomycetes bacterium]|nr:thiopurine S-methyltransferase [Planctomycetota bacterium]
MDHDFWIDRWATQNIGFHRSEAHGALARHWPAGGGELAAAARVLVPLCGKSLDLLWLAERGFTVVGVELAERAVLDFFAENALAFERRDGPLPAFVARDLPLTIHQGDYFALELPPCDALYDRAALVALPPGRRPAYAAHTDSLLCAGALRLVVTFEYDQALVAGPPFAVPADEVRGYWPELAEVERYDAGRDAPPKFRAAGAVVTEVVWVAGR